MVENVLATCHSRLRYICPPCSPLYQGVFSSMLDVARCRFIRYITRYIVICIQMHTLHCIFGMTSLHSRSVPCIQGSRLRVHRSYERLLRGYPGHRLIGLLKVAERDAIVQVLIPPIDIFDDRAAENVVNMQLTGFRIFRQHYVQVNVSYL